MASGSIELTSSRPNNYKGSINWSSKAYPDGNYSLVDVNVYVILNNWGIQGTGAGQFKENGTTTQNFSPYVNIPEYGAGTVWVFKKEGIKVYHNSNGDASINLGCDMQFNFAGISNIGGSQTVTLDHIDRYLKITKFQVKEAYMSSGVFEWAVDNPKEIAAAKFSIVGSEQGEADADYPEFIAPYYEDFNSNTNYQIKLRVKRSTNNLWTEQTINFKTADKGRILNVNNMVAGASQDIQLQFNGGETFKLYLQIRNKKSDEYVTIFEDEASFLNIVGNSMSYTLDTSIEDILDDIYYYGWDSAVDARLIFQSGVQPIENDIANFKILITDANPIVNDFNFKEGDSTCQALTGGTKFIKGYSDIILLSNGLDFEFQKYDALLKDFCKKIRFECGSKYKEFDFPATQGVTNIATLTDVDGNSAILKVYDVRNNEGSLAKSIDLIDYKDIVINDAKIERRNGVDTTCYYSFSGKVDIVNFGQAENYLKKARYRKRAKNGSWQSWINISSSYINIDEDGNFSVSNLTATNFTTGTEYQFEIEVSDELSIYSIVLDVNGGQPLVCINRTKKWIGVGNVPVSSSENLKNNSLKVSGDIKAIGDIYVEDTLLKTYIVNLICPVGHILITENPANPVTYYGVGTWVLTAQGKTLVGVDTNDTDFNKVGKTGGEKTHKLTVEEMPSHKHSIAFDQTNGSNIGGLKSNVANVYWNNRYSSSTGGDKAHNNLQPYYTVYFWKRTA